MAQHSRTRDPEVWRPVVSFDGRYLNSHEVSNRHRVRSLDRMIHPRGGGMPYRIRGRMLSTLGGRVTLCVDGEQIPNAVVADLVRWAFGHDIPAPGTEKRVGKRAEKRAEKYPEIHPDLGPSMEGME